MFNCVKAVIRHTRDVLPVQAYLETCAEHSVAGAQAKAVGHTDAVVGAELGQSRDDLGCSPFHDTGEAQDCGRDLEGELFSWAVVESGADRPCVVTAGGQSPGGSGPEDVDHQAGPPDAVEPARAKSASGPRPSRYARRASAGARVSALVVMFDSYAAGAGQTVPGQSLGSGHWTPRATLACHGVDRLDQCVSAAAPSSGCTSTLPTSGATISREVGWSTGTV